MKLLLQGCHYKPTFLVMCRLCPLESERRSSSVLHLGSTSLVPDEGDIDQDRFSAYLSEHSQNQDLSVRDFGYSFEFRSSEKTKCVYCAENAHPT